MPLPSLRAGNKKNPPAPQAPESLLPDSTPQEFRVLLSACRVFLGTEEPAKLEALLQRGPEWERLLALSNRHGVMPLLYRSISQNCPQAVPAEWLARLRKQYMMNAVRNMKMTAELLRLLDLFEENGIEAIPFKGPALAQQAYGDIALRTFGDLDIMVHKKDVLRTKNLLLANEYQSLFQLNPAQEKACLKSDCEYCFHHKSLGVSLEIHWQMAPAFYSLKFDEKGIWSRAKTIILERRIVLSLSPEDLLIALCIHGAKHCWLDSLPKQISDLSRLIEENRDIDWKIVKSLGRDLHAEKVILLGIILARDLLNATVPDEFSNNFENDPIAKSLESNILKKTSRDSSKTFKQLEALIFWSRAHDYPLDNLFCTLHLAFYTAFEPNAKDFSLIALPAKLYPLYYIIRPIRLLSDYAIKKKNFDN